MATATASLALLRQELGTLLDELQAVLSSERDALRHRDSAGLEAAAARKLELVTSLERATGKYCRAGGKLNRQELGALGVQAKACAQTNRANGGAIELNRNMLGRLIDTLRGGPPAIATYDASGHLRRRNAGRAVGHA